MEIGTCFIINECNFKDEIVKEVKAILLKNDYTSIVAEEIPAYNVGLLEHKVLKPMEEADFVIVLLSPRGEQKKEANFNVAFEFGYARGMNKDVILLFDGEMDDLPSDIKGDYAISLLNLNWKQELNALITKQTEQKQGKFVDLPEIIVKRMEMGVKDKTFDIFADLLNKFSFGFKIVENHIVVNLILRIFDETKYQIYSGEPIKKLLSALNTILYLDKSEKSEELKKELIKYLPMILQKSEQELVLKEALYLTIKINHEDAVNGVIQFILNKKDEELRYLDSFHWNFVQFSPIEFCNMLLQRLALKPN